MKVERRKGTANNDVSRSYSEDSSSVGSNDSKKGYRGYFRYLVMIGLFISALTVFYVVEIDPTHVSSLRALKSFSSLKEEDPTPIVQNSAKEEEVIQDIRDVDITEEVHQEIEKLVPEETITTTTVLQNLENEDPLPWKSKGNRKKGMMGDRYEEEEEGNEIDEEDDDDDDGDDGNSKEKGDAEKDNEEEEGEEGEFEDPKEDGENLRRKKKKKSKAGFPREQEMVEEVNLHIEKIRHMKQEGVVMETNEEALSEIAILQDKLRVLLRSRYGSPPYTVEMGLGFPDSMLATGPAEDKILFELGPIELVPYSVYFFLEIIKNWKGGSFHRNAGHVLQAMVSGNRQQGMAFQEYHPDFPHLKYTMGYAGRPGGPAFYISTQNNKWNHGPGSQGSKTEADGCFGVIGDATSKKVVDRMTTQPGGGKGSGFIEDSKDFIRILYLKLL